MLVEVDIEHLDKLIKPIESLGYIMMNQTASRISFNKGYTINGYSENVFHLHLRKLGDKDELYFRDYLNKHLDEAKVYQDLKIELSKRYKHDRDQYTLEKAEFVKKMTEKGKIEHKLFILKKIANALNIQDLKWHLGASCMLYLRGHIESFNDIDLFISDKDIFKAKSILDQMGKLKDFIKSNDYATKHFYEYIIDVR